MRIGLGFVCYWCRLRWSRLYGITSCTSGLRCFSYNRDIVCLVLSLNLHDNNSLVMRLLPVSRARKLDECLSIALASLAVAQ